jgi:hypothetical protein
MPRSEPRLSEPEETAEIAAVMTSSRKDKCENPQGWLAEQVRYPSYSEKTPGCRAKESTHQLAGA